MERSCSNCYFKHRYSDDWCWMNASKPVKDICDNHSFTCKKCEMDIGTYKYDGNVYCIDCLLKEFNVEESVTTNYYHNGEYIGSDEDMSEVIGNLDCDIEDI